MSNETCDKCGKAAQWHQVRYVYGGIDQESFACDSDKWGAILVGGVIRGGRQELLDQ